MNIAVITGASKGLGEEFARQLAARRVNLLLVARSEELLIKLAEELSQRHGIRAIPFPCDLAKPGAAKEIHKFMEESNLHPTWLINNAGFGLFGALDSLEHSRLTDMAMLNMVVLTDLTRLMLPQMRLGRDSRIINVASTAAFQPVPFFTLYAATKAFVLRFTEGLREEMRGTDVRVLALCPGPTLTKFHEESEIPIEYFQRGQTAQEVVRMGLRASDRRQTVCVTTRPWLVMLLRFFPAWLIRYGAGMIARRVMKSMKREEKN